MPNPIADPIEHPMPVGSVHAGGLAPAHSVSSSVSSSSSQLLATSTGDELAAAIQELRNRGVTNAEEFDSLTVSTINDTCRWFDAPEQRQRSVGAGVLVAELRAGGKPGWRPGGRGSVVDEQQKYCEQICQWLAARFPDLCDGRWGPHPAAIAAVIQLHHRDGKGVLTKTGHGAEIRAAVRAFDAKWLATPQAVSA